MGQSRSMHIEEKEISDVLPAVRNVGPLNRILSMNKGVGEDSYAKNSTLPHQFTENTFHILSETLWRMKLPTTGPIVVADLGCSSTLNTINNVSRIVEVLKERCLTSGRAGTQFQAYFNDLPSTDFNSLFQLLQLDSSSRDFFVAAVPGSCHVEDKDSHCYNQERLWLHASSAAVVESFKHQGKTDLKNFLDARAEELVPGGTVFCIFSGSTPNSGVNDWLRPLSEDKPTTLLSLRRLMEYAWEELIYEGVLTREQRASLNLPNYVFAREDVKDVLENYSYAFTVERFEEIVTNIKDLPPSDQAKWIDKFVKGTKAAYTPLFVAHLGRELTSAFFCRLHELASNTSSFDGCFNNFVLALIRK